MGKRGWGGIEGLKYGRGFGVHTLWGRQAYLRVAKMLGWCRSLLIRASSAGVISGVRGVSVICTSCHTLNLTFGRMLSRGVGEREGGSGEGWCLLPFGCHL